VPLMPQDPILRALEATDNYHDFTRRIRSDIYQRVAPAERDPLPPAEVQVTKDSPAPDHHRDTVTISRPGTNHGEPKTYTGEGATPAEATRDVFRKFLDDPSSGEFHAHRRPSTTS
jgi:hypothetical protein